MRRFVTLYHGGELTEAEKDATAYADGRCDGLILTPPFCDESITAPLRDMHFPFVTIGDSNDHPFIPSVDIDNESAGKRAAQYLLGQGHRNILALTTYHYPHATRRRLSGCRQEVVRQKGRYREAMIAGKTDADAIEALQGYLTCEESERPTAIFCLTDQIALQVLRVLPRLGQNVPRDISVMGFDDIPEATDAGLTTIRQNPVGIGEEATRLLMRLISTPAEEWLSEPIKITMPTFLVERGSVTRNEQ